VTTQAASTAIVTGAAGQDGYYLVARLLAEGRMVHAVVRDAARAGHLASIPDADRLALHELDVTDGDGCRLLIAAIRPDELYNLAGLSSVRRSFESPTETWRSNADAVQGLLEAVRVDSPATRFYQSSSTDMFGSSPGGVVVHDETSAFVPQSPYAAAKSAAHVLCDAYRRAFGLRIACGILSNHESRRRPLTFLAREVVDYVRGLRDQAGDDLRQPVPMRVGNLASRRDWGFAPDYVDGIIRVIRQVEVRAAVAGTPAEPDSGSSYRDYVLGTGELHAVWELIDRAFALGGIPVAWDRASPDPATWCARLERTGALVVEVDPARMRPTDPVAVGADATRAREELGWVPRTGLDAFLEDMLAESVQGA